jgi:hypothetical protein
MVEEESVQIALEYIKAGKGKVSSGDLVGYMDSPSVEFKFRTTEMTTRYKIIEELKTRGSIIIPEHRQGQKQLLIFNETSEFDRIIAVVDKINNDVANLEDPNRIKSAEEAIKNYDEYWVNAIKFLETALKLELFNVNKEYYLTSEPEGLKVNRVGHTPENVELLNSKIAKAWMNLSLRDSKVTHDINLLKQYVKYHSG